MREWKAFCQDAGWLGFALLIVFGILLWAVLFLLPALALAQAARPRTPPACTHWAAPGASGNVCSESQPCQIKTWLGSHAGPGKVLCTKDGRYTGENQMIDIPEGLSGTAERPVVIRALNPGKTLIDGEDSIRPINTRGSYGVILGMNACCGDNEVVMLRGDHWLLKDLMAWKSGAGGDTVIHMSGNNNTVEDCGTFGTSRKSIAAGAAGGENNTITRCWTRWEGNEHPTSNPSVSLEVGYGQNAVLVQNSISMWNRTGRQTEPEGAGELFSSRDSKWLGSFFVIQHTDDYAPNTVMAAYVDAGSQSQQGQFNPLTNLVFRHNVAFIDPRHPGFSGKKGFMFNKGSDGGPPGTNNTVSDLVSVSGTQSTFSSRSFPTSNIQWGRSLAEAIGQGKSLWTDSAAAPGICKRYVRGQLTDEGLWPWPSEQRLKDAMTLSGTQPVSVTALMESLFGPIPAQCRTTGTGPGPTPPSTVPVPPTDVEAVLQGTGVLLSWVDETNTVATGYTIERKVGGGQYAELSTAPAVADRSYTDTAPVRGQNNCYVVYARGNAGPSGFSVPGCVTVPTTPVPPEPPGTDRVPLTCEGAIVTGNRVVMTCVPQVGRR